MNARLSLENRHDAERMFFFFLEVWRRGRIYAAGSAAPARCTISLRSVVDPARRYRVRNEADTPRRTPQNPLGKAARCYRLVGHTTLVNSRCREANPPQTGQSGVTHNAPHLGTPWPTFEIHRNHQHSYRLAASSVVLMFLTKAPRAN